MAGIESAFRNKTSVRDEVAVRIIDARACDAEGSLSLLTMFVISRVVLTSPVVGALSTPNSTVLRLK
jgi:hypothetical protein